MGDRRTTPQSSRGGTDPGSPHYSVTTLNRVGSVGSGSSRGSPLPTIEEGKAAAAGAQSAAFPTPPRYLSRTDFDNSPTAPAGMHPQASPREPSAADGAAATGFAAPTGNPGDTDAARSAAAKTAAAATHSQSVLVDDADGNLLVSPGDAFCSPRTGNVYTVVERLGSGSFGMVVKCSVVRPRSAADSVVSGTPFVRPLTEFPSVLSSPFDRAVRDSAVAARSGDGAGGAHRSSSSSNAISPGFNDFHVSSPGDDDVAAPPVFDLGATSGDHNDSSVSCVSSKLGSSDGVGLPPNGDSVVYTSPTSAAAMAPGTITTAMPSAAPAAVDPPASTSVCVSPPAAALPRAQLQLGFASATPPEFVAIKIVRNHIAYYTQATMEIHILTLLKRQLAKKAGDASAAAATIAVPVAGPNSIPSSVSNGNGSDSSSTAQGGASSSSTATSTTTPAVPTISRASAAVPSAAPPSSAAAAAAVAPSYTSESDSLITILDHFSHASHVCLVFEYLPATLLDALTSSGYTGLPLAAVRAVMRQLMRGLAAIHRLQLCHGDVKPENIMLTQAPRTAAATTAPAVATTASAAAEWSHATAAAASTAALLRYHTPPKLQLGSSSCVPHVHPHEALQVEVEPRIKLIDFGSACYEGTEGSHYVQSRFYRAPEVMLGLPYRCVRVCVCKCV